MQYLFFISKKNRIFAHSNIPKMEQEKYQEDSLEAIDTLEDEGCKLILYNDDYHTFDYVILALRTICGHSEVQAEQCTLLVHCKGKCVVKTGEYDKLLPMHAAFLDRQLTTEIIH